MSKYMPNINFVTGIAYGYIHAQLLHPEVVDDLLYKKGTNLTYEAARKEAIEQARAEFDSNGTDDEFDEDRAEYEFELNYVHPDECDYEGEMDGVKYASSWLGGALHFFIFELPVIVEVARCSPCVPGAGDLGNPGTLQAYGVPEDWKAESHA